MVIGQKTGVSNMYLSEITTYITFSSAKQLNFKGNVK